MKNKHFVWQLIIGLLLGGLTAVWAGQFAGQTMLEYTDERLKDAGARANVSLNRLEGEQHALVRAISFTEGVVGPVVEADSEQLQQIVLPLQANSSVPIVNVLDVAGNIILSVRSEHAPPPASTELQWDIIARVVAGQSDRYGDSWTALVEAEEGVLLATAGPVRDEEQLVGVVVVATPLTEVFDRLMGGTPVFLSIYSEAGRAGYGMGSITPDIEPQLAASIIHSTGSSSVPRSFVLGQETKREQIGRFMIRGEAAALLGASLPEPAAALARAVTLQVATGMAAIVIVLVTLLLRVSRRDADA